MWIEDSVGDLFDVDRGQCWRLVSCRQKTMWETCFMWIEDSVGDLLPVDR